MVGGEVEGGVIDASSVGMGETALRAGLLVVLERIRRSFAGYGSGGLRRLWSRVASVEPEHV